MAILKETGHPQFRVISGAVADHLTFTAKETNHNENHGSRVPRRSDADAECLCQRTESG
jgi:hypothetical protein